MLQIKDPLEFAEFINEYGYDSEEVKAYNEFELGEKIIEYKKYIDTHIKAFSEMYWKHREAIANYLKINLDFTNPDEHDASKLSLEEFNGYRAKYYPTQLEKWLSERQDRYADIVEEAYQYAWLHHVHNNPHHPEHWALVEKEITIFDMPDKDLACMVVDLLAMSHVFKNSIREWYYKEGKDKFKLGDQTRSNLESLIAIVDAI